MIGLSLTGGIRGIVLDAVGTLIEPDPPVAVAYAAAARRQGIDLDVAVVKSRFIEHYGRDALDDAREVLVTSEAAEVRRWRRIVAGVLPEVPDPERAFDELWHHFGQASAWRLVPEAALALRALRAAGIAVRVASNFDARLRGVLAGLPAAAELAPTAVISSEVGWRKPHPAFYRAACEALGLSPGAVLAVGDDPENDFHGPRRAGLSAVLVDRDGRLPPELPSLRNLAELVELLTAPGLADRLGAGR
jgi:putative hydrolase of the HAD superfamily